jgi:hypothetical protein
MSATVSRDADECVICDAPVPDPEEHGLTLDDPEYDLVIPLCSPACRDRYAELAVALGEGRL